VAQVCKKFVHGTRNLIAVYTRALSSGPYDEPFETIHRHKDLYL